MAISLVQSFAATGFSGTQIIETVSFTPGSLVIIEVGCSVSSSTQKLSSVTQTNVPWAELAGSPNDYNAQGRQSQIFTAIVGSSPGTTLTMDFTANTGIVIPRVRVLEFSGTNLAEDVPLVKTQTIDFTGDATITPTAGKSIVLIAVTATSGSNTVTGVGSGWTQTPNSIYGGCAFAYQIVSSASGSYNPAFAGGGDAWATTVAVFAETPSSNIALLTNMETVSNVVASSTSNIREVLLRDPVTYAPKTGLTNSGMTCYYAANGGASSSRTLVAGTLNTFVSLGIKEIDLVNRPGWYQFSIANADITAEGDFTYQFGGNCYGVLKTYVFGSSPYTAALSAATIVAAFFTRTFDAVKMGGITFAQLIGLVYSSAAAGKLSGAVAGSPSSIVVKNPGDTATAIAASTDAAGNRSSVTVTPSAIE